jgi:hypothetical protein
MNKAYWWLVVSFMCFWISLLEGFFAIWRISQDNYTWFFIDLVMGFLFFMWCEQYYKRYKREMKENEE